MSFPQKSIANPNRSLLNRIAPLSRASLVLGIGLVLGLVALTAGCGDTESVSDHSWPQDFEAAQAESRETGKPMIVLFTGSDWCPPCMRLEKKVLSKPDFHEWADENVVFVMLDYPRSKPQSAKIEEQNTELLREFETKVAGFPTMLVMDADKNVLGSLDFAPSGPKALIKEAESVIGKTKKG